MFYEWCGRTVKTEAYFRGKYQVKKGDILYYPYIKNNSLLLQEIIVYNIEYDANAPTIELEGPKVISNISKLRFIGGKKWLEVPLWLCSKDKIEARNIFMKYSKHLKQIKIRNKK
jgi:hypothetical protein